MTITGFLLKALHKASKFSMENNILSSYIKWILLNIALMILFWEKLKSSSALATGYLLYKTVVANFNLFKVPCITNQKFPI